MVNLFIDGQLVVIAAGTAVTLTRNNPYFTNSGDFTFDISLPMQGCIENQRIFGSIQRSEASLAHLVNKKFPFVLQIPPLRLQGHALVISANEKDIRVQLLAGNSQFNIDQLEEVGKDIYVDEMELGEAYREQYPDAYDKGDRFYARGSDTIISPRYLLVSHLHEETDDNILYGSIAATNCVNFPIYSTADDAVTNERMLKKVVTNGITDYRYRYNYFKPSSAFGECHFAAQPYLVVVLERVIEQLGYTVRSNAIRGTWMENIFIANAKDEYKFARTLPHWTVPEFLKEIRQFFGVFLLVDGHNVDIVTRKTFYSNQSTTTELKDIIDEHEVQLEADSDSEDVTAGNIDYDHESTDDMLRLPDDVWGNAIVKVFANLTLMTDWINNNIPDNKKKLSAWILVNEQTDETFAYLQSVDDSNYYLAQVDCCPPLIRDGEQYGPKNRDIDISLRIVPVKMDLKPIDYGVSIVSGRVPEEQYFKGRISVPMFVTRQTRESHIDVFSVNDTINKVQTEDNTGSEIQVIEVALNMGDRWRGPYLDESNQKQYADFPVSYGIAYIKQQDGFYLPIVGYNNHDQLKLTKRDGDSIYTTVLEPGINIDTRCVHIFSFIDDVVVVPTNTYLINNKKYACQKVEYIFDDKRMDRVKRGYFFEINPQRNDL